MYRCYNPCLSIYKPGSTKKKTAEKLINENRVNFVCPADYSENKEMHNVVKIIIDKIKADTDFVNLQEKHKTKAVKK